jgi:hypothetical protein
MTDGSSRSISLTCILWRAIIRVNLLQSSSSRLSGDEDFSRNCVHLFRLLYLSLGYIWILAVGSTADNASSNGPLNKKLTQLVNKHAGSRFIAKDIQIGCSAHVINLCAQYVVILCLLLYHSNLYSGPSRVHLVLPRLQRNVICGRSIRHLD